MKVVRVLPGDNENSFFKLYEQFRFKMNVRRLGKAFGWIYNEYEVSDFDYDAFKEEIDAVAYEVHENAPKSFKDKLNRFVTDHSLEIVVSVGSVALLVTGISIGSLIGMNVQDRKCVEMVKEAAAKGFSIGGLAGMSSISRFIADKVPEANEILSKYCLENNVDFASVFSEHPTVAGFKEVVGNIELPL